MHLQDLAVVVLLMLIPLLAPAENGAQAAGFSKIAKALGVAAVKVAPLLTGLLCPPVFVRLIGLMYLHSFILEHSCQDIGGLIVCHHLLHARCKAVTCRHQLS
jgi:hypothetical protein